MTNSPRVIAFGEVLWDLLPDGKVLGGAAANFVYRLNELGVPTALISRLGNDELGDEARHVLQERGFAMNYIQRDPTKPTGTVDVRLSANGDADYTIIPGVAYDFIQIDEALINACQSAEAICFGTLIQRNDISRESLYRLLDACPTTLKLVDVNLRKDCFSKETILNSLRRADILKLNRDEVRVLCELLGLNNASCRAFAEQVIGDFALKTVLITQGSEGVLTFDETGSEFEICGVQVEVEDTVGAGDNFTAGFLKKLLAGEDIEESCRFGNLIGSLVASRKGGMPKITRMEIEARC